MTQNVLTETRFPRWKLRPLLLSAFILLGFLSPCGASEGPDADGSIEDDGGAVEPPGYDEGWFALVGVANYHTRLEESERAIDEGINRPFGKILPRWQEPETFKDWSEDWKLWSLWAGFGRDFHAEWSWALTVGGSEGTVKNSNDHHPLLLPTDIKVDFTRLEAYLEGALTWHPWGKPDISEDPDSVQSGGLRRAMLGARPFLDLAAGYNYQKAEADVRVKLPLVGTVFREQQKDDFHLLYVNPRIGVEIPIDDKNSVGLSAGYVFFHEHGDEFDSVVFNVFFRHKF